MTKEKKERDPNAPKRPMSAWLYWLDENRERLKEEAKASGENLLKCGGEEWKALEDKRNWEEMATKDKERYFREIGKGESPQPDVSKKKAASASTTKPTGKSTKAAPESTTKTGKSTKAAPDSTTKSAGKSTKAKQK